MIMLKKIFKELDKWIDEQNVERVEDGMLSIAACEIKVIGQTALLEAKISLHVPATMDVDVFANYEYSVRKKFADLLNKNGKELDPVGHEAWMPIETEYDNFFVGKWLKTYLAKPEYVLLSKAKMAPDKNKALIVEYLASTPPSNFFELAKKYKVDLDSFLE
jgi:hypothetical protein